MFDTLGCINDDCLRGDVDDHILQGATYKLGGDGQQYNVRALEKPSCFIMDSDVLRKMDAWQKLFVFFILNKPLGGVFAKLPQTHRVALTV